MDGVRRTGLEVLALKDVTLKHLRQIWVDIPHYEQYIDKQIEIDAHYSGYLKKQFKDIAAFKKDESIAIPEAIDYDRIKNLILKEKLKIIKPKTLGQALRIDGITPAAAILLLGHSKL